MAGSDVEGKVVDRESATEPLGQIFEANHGDFLIGGGYGMAKLFAWAPPHLKLAIIPRLREGKGTCPLPAPPTTLP